MSNAVSLAQPREMNYDLYATQFDNLCEINPAYQELLHIFENTIATHKLPCSPRVCDLGAGTGNFICRLYENRPAAEVWHVDCNSSMNSQARDKYARINKSPIIIEQYMQDVEFEPASLDLVVCVNALNNAPPALPMLNKMRSWLQPSGILFLIDFGRQMRVFDWSLYLIKNSLKERGLRGTIQGLIDTRKAFSSNRAGGLDQKNGGLWLHSTEELVDLVELAQLTPLQIQTCYRGCADLIVARPAA